MKLVSQLNDVLSQYVSPITASGMLRRAMRDMGVAEHQLEPSRVRELVASLETGMTLFVDTSARPALRAALQKMAAPAADRTERIEVATENDVSSARLAARAMCVEAGAGGLVVQKVATGVSELARNIVQYVGRGAIEITLAEQPQRLVSVRAVDAGRGIPNVELVLSGTYKSKTGLGRGILGIKRMADRFQINSTSSGTRIEFEIWF